MVEGSCCLFNFTSTTAHIYTRFGPVPLFIFGGFSGRDFLFLGIYGFGNIAGGLFWVAWFSGDGPPFPFGFAGSFRIKPSTALHFFTLFVDSQQSMASRKKSVAFVFGVLRVGVEGDGTG